MEFDRPMYRWRRLTPAERRAVLEYRRKHHLPWHGPPHYVGDSGWCLITAACYEHRHVIGATPERLARFETELIENATAASQRHFWATMNYVLHNAVHHGHIERWQDWPYSNASRYLEEVGREEAERRWREYPVLDYGKDWDPLDL